MTLNRKMAVAGDPIVGKTSLINRLIHNRFTEEYILTVGTNILKKTFIFKESTRQIMVNNWIWDISGHHSMALVMDAYLHGAHGSLLVCDASRKETIRNLRYWVEAVRDIGNEIPIVIAVNKIDLAGDTRKEVVAEIHDLFPELLAFPTSAKTGENVETVFRALNTGVLEKEGIDL